MPRGWRLVSLVAVLGVLAAVAVVTAFGRTRTAAGLSATIGARGGTYHLGELVVTAAPGTVAKDTTLTATQPAPLTGDQAGPLQGVRTAGLRFDLALAGGAQPLKPLDLSIRLAGRWLPAGAQPGQALLYTGVAGTANATNATPEANAPDYRLVPAGIDPNGLLTARLAHLSPKFITFVAPVVLTLGDLAYLKLPAPAAPACPQQVATPGAGQVRLVPDPGGGWSTGAGSVVHPCLAATGDQVRLEITNNAHYVWSLAASAGVAVEATSGNAENELVKRLAARLFPDAPVKAYLSRDDKAVATVATTALPATVQLQASPSTFLAETVWIATKFIVGLLTGGKASETLEIVDQLTDLPQVLSCLQSTVKVSNGTGTPEDIFDAVVSTCTEKLAEAVGQLVSDPKAWNRFWRDLITVTGGINDAISDLNTAYAGITQQIKGLVTIKVERVAPPTATCPTADEVLTVARAAGEPTNATIHGGIPCRGGWAMAAVYAEPAPPEPPQYVLQAKNGSWKLFTTMIDGYPSDLSQCAQLPAWIKQQINANCP